jgi:hypothetical protein
MNSKKNHLSVFTGDVPTPAETNNVHQPAPETTTNLKETQTMTTSVTSEGRPNKDWTLKNLEKYALDRVQEIHGFGRKTTVQLWLFGEALSLIRQRQKESKTWMDWVKTQPYSLTTATNAIKFWERIGFDDLQSYDGMSLSDLKAVLDIIKLPPVPKRRKQTPVLPTTEQAIDQTTGNAPEATDQTTDAPEATDESTDAPNKAAERKVTTTDYSQKGRKSEEPKVGPDLTAAEMLGQALNMLIAAEEIGVSQDCSGILTELATKIGALLQTIASAQSA